MDRRSVDSEHFVSLFIQNELLLIINREIESYSQMNLFQNVFLFKIIKIVVFFFDRFCWNLSQNAYWKNNSRVS